MRFGVITNDNVTLGPDELGQTIILRRPDQKAKDELQDLLGSLKVDGQGKDTSGQEMRIFIGSMRRFRRQHSVVAWTLKDAAGNLLPLTKEALDQIDDDTREYLDGEISKLWDGASLTSSEKNG